MCVAELGKRACYYENCSCNYTTVTAVASEASIFRQAPLNQDTCLSTFKVILFRLVYVAHLGLTSSAVQATLIDTTITTKIINSCL